MYIPLYLAIIEHGFFSKAQDEVKIWIILQLLKKFDPKFKTFTHTHANTQLMDYFSVNPNISGINDANITWILSEK